MIYPPQTSLIPVAVALARYIEVHGVSGVYPYWYLGSTPIRYLTGPIVPGILITLRKLLPGLSFFDLTYLLIVLSFLIGAVGWGRLVYSLSRKRALAIAVGTIYIFLPWHWLSAFAMAEPSAVIAANLVPFALLSLQASLTLAVLSISLVLFVNISAIPTLVIAEAAFVFREVGLRKRAASALVISVLLVTLWYLPSFWITILNNPSVGGKSLFSGLGAVIDLGRDILPLALAVLVVYFGSHFKDRFRVFVGIWLLTFAFLTIFRFLANRTFWQDWLTWFYELEIGLSFICAYLITKNRNIKRYFVALCLITVDLLITSLIYQKLESPALASTNPPAFTKSLKVLNDFARNQTVFLSGSTVFWADAFYDLHQVRGGRDEASVNRIWPKAAWEIRQGRSPEETSKWLQDLNIHYVLVHTDLSTEFYHDFKNLDKWDKIGRKVWENNGDSIYRLK